MSDILHARTMSFNCVRAMKFGYKPTVLERAIMLRSDHTHMEFQFSIRYASVSASSTLRDGVKGFRFKPIEYSHPEYWDAVYIPVTVEQERAMWTKACDMADVPENYMLAHLSLEPQQYISEEFTHGNKCYYGPGHIKYDLFGAAFSYWTKFKIWKPSKTKMVCNRASTEVVLAGYPEAMNTSDPTKSVLSNNAPLVKQADYASMTPSETDGMFRNYFSIEGK